MHQVKPTEPTNRVRMEARLPVSIRDHGPGRRQQQLGAAAPKPAKLSQLDRVFLTPKSPEGDFAPPVPPGSGA